MARIKGNAKHFTAGKSKQPRRPDGTEFVAYQKNLDLMKLLVTYAPFQKEVHDARAQLGIPEHGLAPKDAQTAEQWYKEFIRKSDKITDSPKFGEQLRMIGKRLDSGEIGPRMAEKQSRLMYLKVPVNYFTHVSHFLAQKYNVPDNFSYYIQRYILYGVVNAPVNNFVCGDWPAWTMPSEVRYLPVKIYARLTRKEFKDLKKEVELMGKHLPRFQALHGVGNKLTIEEWYSNREVSHFEGDYKMSVAEFAENMPHARIKVKSVYEAVRELRELRQKRFGKH